MLVAALENAHSSVLSVDTSHSTMLPPSHNSVCAGRGGINFVKLSFFPFIRSMKSESCFLSQLLIFLANDLVRRCNIL